MPEKYLKINIISENKNSIEIINALIVNELDIYGIEEEEEGITVYIRQTNFKETEFKNLVDINDVKYYISEVNNKNWNEEWEKNFDPVVVDDFVSILADFHEKINGVEHEIRITPKMSFGTGHHATTHMMVAMMRKYGRNAPVVVDFGTGTGVLAILAEKMGAGQVLAIDCDDWSIENAAENMERNTCRRIALLKADSFAVKDQADLILANINRNVIVDNLPAIARGVKEGGIVIFSGILTTDLPELENLAAGKKLLKLKEMEKNNWVCAAFKKGQN
ncbi:MAG: 50S ribosomal protein L11 methyltransferase [Chitinophagaceae bacterium]|nr:50S ribosomal protein L11 methyltransferase [Chitinophagaceae bacterium]